MIVSEKVDKDITISSQFWTQVSELISWDELDYQFSTTQRKRRELRLSGRSYYDVFFRNSIKLSNPNRSGAGISSLISKSESATDMPDEKGNLGKLDSFKHFFTNSLLAKANDDNDEEAYLFLKNLFSTHRKEDILLWIQQIFNDNCKNEKVVVGLLRLFGEFSFEEVNPVAMTIAACCKNHKSYAIKSATFSLLGHWCNKEALDIITAFEEPREMMLRVKYKKLKDIITVKCTT